MLRSMLLRPPEQHLDVSGTYVCCCLRCVLLLQVMDLGRRGIRSLAVARTNEEGKWQMMGILTFLDPPRSDTKVTIERALEYGVDVKMITGACTCIRK
jgi:H+-transporting ATPase